MADDLVAAGGPGQSSPGPSGTRRPGESPRRGAAAGRALAAMVRYVLGIAVGVLVVVLLFGRRAELGAAVRQLDTASPAWVAAAIGAESLSLLAYAWLQRHVLGLAGARIRLAGLFLITLANDAIALTVPGEPAVSSGYRYRYYRRQGASAASAGWTIFTILIAQAIGMSIVLLAGVLVALAATAASAAVRPAALGVTIIGLLIVLASGAVLIRRDLVLGLASAVTGRLARLRLTRPGRVRRLRLRRQRRVRVSRVSRLLTRIEVTLARMRDIPLGPRATAGVVTLATAAWVCDFLCLLCGFRAVHAHIPWHGVLLAYGAAQVAGSLPLVPGGLGIVEGSLAVVLVGYGASRVPAVSAVLAYRVVNYWLAVVVGWVSFGLVAFLLRRRPAGDEAPGIDPVGPKTYDEVTG